MKWFLVVFALFALTSPAISYDPDEMLADPVLEARARALSAELRCLVCQNQSIDDSDATFAKDLRMLVRERLVIGDTDGQIVNYLVERYGEFILLRPYVALHTLALWGFTPFVMLIAIIALTIRLRRRKKQLAPVEDVGTAMTRSEQKVLDSLLDRDKD